ETHDRLAALLRARGDAAGAARHLRRAIQLSSGAELSDRLVELATMEGKDLGLPVEAAEHFLQAAQIRPDDLVLAEQVARAQFEANRPDRAHASLERIAQSLDGKRGERSHQVWSMLANSCGALGDGWG